ncbi:hypothetical protein H072_6743 [Dactylellina haptotyla CBS 200.50]|uniref:CHAT domain-containing protein n=1 Tax=Dactylellina haptotyla (strain CBS 200.50) TaxID=1284197 RepID=S8A994_DACHA|nr:hypothetical protein H072_6743 [Dactylellina haptotyla CBS 200.50]
MNETTRVDNGVGRPHSILDALGEPNTDSGNLYSAFNRIWDTRGLNNAFLDVVGGPQPPPETVYGLVCRLGDATLQILHLDKIFERAREWFEKANKEKNLNYLHIAVYVMERLVSGLPDDIPDPTVILMWDELSQMYTLRQRWTSRPSNPVVTIDLSRAMIILRLILRNLERAAMRNPEIDRLLANCALCYRKYAALMDNWDEARDALDFAIHLMQLAIEKLPLAILREIEQILLMPTTEGAREIETRLRTLKRAEWDYQIDLGDFYNFRYERFGELADLDRAIEENEKILDAMNTNYRGQIQPLPGNYLIRCMSNISHYYNSRFFQKGFGATSDLEKAIEFGELLVSGSITRDYSGKTGDAPPETSYRTNLALCYFHRFQVFEDEADITTAIELAEGSIAIHGSYEGVNVDGNADLSKDLNNLQAFYSMKYNTSKDLGDLERSLEYAEKSVGATRIVGPKSSLRSCNLASAHLKYYRITNAAKSLIRAKEILQILINKSKPDPNKHVYLLMSAQCSHWRFKSETGSAEDLRDAIKYATQALDSSQLTTGVRERILTNLADYYEAMYTVDNEAASLKKAQGYLQAAFDDSGISQLDRIKYGVRIFWLCSKNEEIFGVDAVTETMIKAARLFQRIVPRYISRDLQENILSGFAHLSSTICSVVLRAGRPAIEAFEVLESARCFLASTAFNAQSDISRLRLRYPKLYQQYEDLRLEMSRSEAKRTPSLEDLASSNFLKRRPFFINQEMETIEVEIRKIPDFKFLHLFPSVARLQDLAILGPVVALNTSDLRSDALIITSDSVRSLSLDSLQHDDVIAHLGSSEKELSLVSLGQKNREMKKVLSWLWSAAVKPVLSELGFLPPTNTTDLPHIWWVTSGILGLAPLHAAGIYAGVHKECTMDFAISSYIPSIKALEFSRRLSMERGPNVTENMKMLLVAASNPVEAKSFTFCEEVADIKNITVRSDIETTTLIDPQPIKILAHLRNYNIVHFACHGRAIVHNPSASYLETNAFGNTLSISSIAKVKHDKAQLAYLSACSSAENAGGPLIDEAIHLANTFQQSGFPHVVGTLWEAQDECANFIAKQFYKNLFAGREGLNDLSPGNIALSLHKAILSLRNEPLWKHNILGWAPFVHIGG